MNSLAELFISLCELCEAEGRLLQRQALATLRMAALALLGLLFLGAALAFLVAALHAWLSAFLAPVLVYSILALVAAALGGGMLWLSLPRQRGQRHMTTDQARRATPSSAPPA